MRTCDNCTTRKSAPFRVRANLEPLCELLPPAIRFFRVLIPTCPTASLTGRLPWPKIWCRRTIGLTTFPSLPTRLFRRACPFSACLSPGSTFDDVLRWTIEATGYTPFWFGPDSRFGPAILTRFINSSPMLRMRNLPCTSHRTAAGSVDSFPVAGVNLQSRGTLSPELHTQPLPAAHVWIGNCWSYSRSQHCNRFRSPRTTRPGRALPPTTCRLTRG